MKIDPDKYEDMRANVHLIWEALKLKYPAALGTKHGKDLTDGELHDLWFRTWASIAYSDENPNVLRYPENSKRVLCHVPNYPMYPCGTNDKTLLTALRKIAKTLS